MEPFITLENSADNLYKSNLILSCNFLAVQQAVSPNIPYTLETPSNEYQRLLNQQVSVSKARIHGPSMHLLQFGSRDQDLWEYRENSCDYTIRRCQGTNLIRRYIRHSLCLSKALFVGCPALSTIS